MIPQSDKPGKGLPLGNLTSQLLANVYLDALDQYVKCALGERWYVRYMDDFILWAGVDSEIVGLAGNTEFFTAPNNPVADCCPRTMPHRHLEDGRVVPA